MCNSFITQKLSTYVDNVLYIKRPIIHPWGEVWCVLCEIKTWQYIQICRCIVACDIYHIYYNDIYSDSLLTDLRSHCQYNDTHMLVSIRQNAQMHPYTHPSYRNIAPCIRHGNEFDIAHQTIRKIIYNQSFKDQTLHWRHNGHDGVSDHQPHDCLLNRLFRRRLKKASKLRVTGLCEGHSPVTGELSKATRHV